MFEEQEGGFTSFVNPGVCLKGHVAVNICRFS